VARKGGEAPSSFDILEGVPVLNAAAEIRHGDGGGMLAEIPVKRSRFLVPPLSWMLPYSKRRRVRLDLLGAAILDLCDGKRTIGDLIETFAHENKLSYREAQLPVMQFMRMLTERGVIVISGGAGKAES
jgi:hypothetical protein